MKTTKQKKEEVKKPLTLSEITDKAEVLSKTRKKLSEKIKTMNDEKEKIEKKHMDMIRKYAKEVNDAQAVLESAVRENRDAFKDKKTHEAHGVKFGFSSSGGGAVQYDDEKQVISNIKEHFPLLVKVLIKTEEKIIANSVKNLPEEDRSKIGVTLSAGGEHLVLKTTDTAIDDIINSVKLD